MKKVSLIIFILVSITKSYLVNAQGTSFPSVLPKSPNVESLAVFGAIPVSHYTGIPQITIPLYEINLDGKSIPISLNYHAGGNKVQQEASWVGLGWALQAGGMISQDVRGKNDFLDANRNGGYATTKIPLEIVAQKVKNGTLDRPYISDGRLWDFKQFDLEPDVFTYNFAGYSGQFFFENGVGEGKYSSKPILKNIKDNISITFTHGNGTPLNKSSWSVIDGDGYTYYFASVEQSNTIVSSSKDPITQADKRLGVWEILPRHELYKYMYVNAWLLDSIKSDKGNVISFKYKNDTISTPINYFEKVHKLLDVETIGESFDRPVFVEVPPTLTQYSYSNIIQLNLSEIIFPGGRVNIETSDREDIDSGYRKLVTYDYTLAAQKLSKMTIYNEQEEQIKQAKFNYILNGSKTKKNCLSSVEIGGYSYSMKYEPITSDKHNPTIDVWGYNNGVPRNRKFSKAENDHTSFGTFLPSYMKVLKSNNVLLAYGADRRPNERVAKEGILTEFKNPTGDIAHFEYSLHTFSNYELPFYSMGKVYGHYYFNADLGEMNGDFPSGPFSFEVTERTLMHSSAYAAVVTNFTKPNSPYIMDGIITHHKDESDIIGKGGQVSVFVDRHPLNKFGEGKDPKESNFIAHPGIYKFKPNRSKYNYNDQHADFIFEYIIQGVNQSFTSAGGGLRIARIKNSNGIREFDYTDSNGQTSGLLMSEPGLFKEFSRKVSGYLGGNTIINGSNIHVRIASNSIIPSSTSASGGIVGYSHIRETQKDLANNTLGSITYTIENEPDKNYGALITTGVPLKPNIGNGNILEQNFYNNKNKLVASTKYSYRKLTNGTDTKEYLGFYVYSIDYDKLSADSELMTLGSNSVVEPYPTQQEWMVKSKMIETLYNGDNNTPIVNVETYDYNPINYQLSSYKRNDIDIKNTYPVDVQSVNSKNKGILSLVNKNMTNRVIEESTYKNNKRISSTYFNYSDSLNIALLESIQIADNDSKKYGTKEWTIEKYSKRGKPLQIRDKDGYVIFYIWAYNNQYPIAEIKNAKLGDITAALQKQGKTIDGLANMIMPNWDVDKFRNDLSSALITTYTYKPLVGMLTSTDPSGKITFYEYDEFNRLQRTYLKDEDNKEQNIENYEYHYRNK